MKLMLRLAVVGLIFAYISNPSLATDADVDTGDAVSVKAQNSASISQEANPDLPLADTEQKVDEKPSSMPAEKTDIADTQESKEDAAAKQDASVVPVKPGKDKKTKGCGGGCALF